MSVPQKCVIIITWLALLSACLYVPFWIPAERTITYGWIWKPIEVPDSLTSSSMDRLDLETLSKEFESQGVPQPAIAMSRTDPDLRLFAAELVLSIVVGYLSFLMVSRSRRVNTVQSGSPEGRRSRTWCLPACSALAILIFTLAYYTRDCKIWSGVDFEVKVEQTRMGAPLHWLSCSRIVEARGQASPGESLESAFRKFPESERYLPGVSVEWTKFVLSIVTLVGGVFLMGVVAPSMSRRIPSLLDLRTVIGIASVIACAAVAFAIMSLTSPPPWARLGLWLLASPVPVFFASRFFNRYNVAVLLSFASTAACWWLYRVTGLFDGSIRRLDSDQDVVLPLFSVALLLAITVGPLAARNHSARV